VIYIDFLDSGGEFVEGYVTYLTSLSDCANSTDMGLYDAGENHYFDDVSGDYSSITSLSLAGAIPVTQNPGAVDGPLDTRGYTTCTAGSMNGVGTLANGWMETNDIDAGCPVSIICGFRKADNTSDGGFLWSVNEFPAGGIALFPFAIGVSVDGKSLNAFFSRGNDFSVDLTSSTGEGNEGGSGLWNYIIFTMDTSRSGGVFQMFYNGVKTSTTFPWDVSTNPGGSSYVSVFGSAASGNNSNSRFDVDIAECARVNRVITDAEAEHLWELWQTRVPYSYFT
jgi:hypothetical protein